MRSLFASRVLRTLSASLLRLLPAWFVSGSTDGDINIVRCTLEEESAFLPETRFFIITAALKS
jgi:hypothetical protein